MRAPLRLGVDLVLEIVTAGGVYTLMRMTTAHRRQDRSDQMTWQASALPQAFRASTITPATPLASSLRKVSCSRARHSRPQPLIALRK